MAKVKLISSGEIYTVYGLSGAMFLLWKDGKWHYECIQDCEAVEDGHDS